MNKDTIDLINQLATKLGTTADHVWAVLLKQAPIQAATQLALILFWLLILAIVAGFMRRSWQAMDERDRKRDWSGPFIGLLIAELIIGVVLAVFIGCALPTIITGFYNPEYWALSQILPTR